MYVSAQLRPLQASLAVELERATHPWAVALRWVLRTRLIIACPLPGRIAGFTVPFIPVILLDRRWVSESLGEVQEPLSDSAGRIALPGACRVAQVLIHEAAHQLWAVWPEWKRWFLVRNVYGPNINAADAISEAVCRELCATTRYPAAELNYKSPLRWLGPKFRQ